MDLLTKFEQVEMKADTRISEADRIFYRRCFRQDSGQI